MSDNPENQGETRKPERDERGRLLPGNTGNPNGRPKGISFVKIFQERLGKRFLTDQGEITRAERMADKFLDDMEEKLDGVAFRDMVDRIDGKATQTVVSVSDEESPFVKAVKEIKEKLQSE